jgi:NADP-dependent 3-hydroxy acid dehydrogenase YdfG
VIAEYGRIDVLFNNAGISGVGALHEVEPDAWDRVMMVNTRGVYLPSKYVLPHMMERKAELLLICLPILLKSGWLDVPYIPLQREPS